MQRIELVLVFGLLGKKPFDKTEKPGKPTFPFGVSGDLAADVAVNTPQIDAQLFQFPTHTAELARMRISSDTDSGRLGKSSVTLAKRNAKALGMLHQK